MEALPGRDQQGLGGRSGPWCEHNYSGFIENETVRELCETRQTKDVSKRTSIMQGSYFCDSSQNARCTLKIVPGCNHNICFSFTRCGTLFTTADRSPSGLCRCVACVCEIAIDEKTSQRFRCTKIGGQSIIIFSVQPVRFDVLCSTTTVITFCQPMPMRKGGACTQPP